MQITVKYFASLRERMGRSEQPLELPASATVADVWRQVAPDSNAATTGTDNEGIMAAVNHDYVERDHALKDGDELAFFPPVTGG